MKYFLWRSIKSWEINNITMYQFTNTCNCHSEHSEESHCYIDLKNLSKIKSNPEVKDPDTV